MSIPIGVLQGRLTPRRGRGIQFSPRGEGEWEKEFELAAAIGLSHLQWACDPDAWIFDAAFRDAVRAVVGRTGVPVKNMDVQFLTSVDIRDCPETLMRSVCEALRDLGAGQAELPLMEASSLLEKDKRSERLKAFEKFLSIANEIGTPVAVETDLPPQDLADFLNTYEEVSVVYDTGNSAGMGYDCEDELTSYGKRISNLHIKDKKVGGTTVPLGEGDSDFQRIFTLLYEMGYTGPVTLQAARGIEGREVELVQEQIQKVSQYAKSF